MLESNQYTKHSFSASTNRKFKTVNDRGIIICHSVNFKFLECFLGAPLHFQQNFGKVAQTV